MKNLILLSAMAALIFAACENFLMTQSTKSENDLRIIPFSNDNQRFGLVDLKGNVIVDNEWERPSSIAVSGIVSVKNKDENFEFFTATSNPKRIGTEYRDVTFFSEGLAAVVNEKGFIHYIDTQGNIKFELPDDGKGSPIQKAGVFSEGLARFQNSENLWGFINPNGEVVIKPRYDYVRNFKEGLALVERYNQTTNERSIGFIDNRDVEIIPLSERYTAFSDFHEGMAACTDKDSKDQWGYINKIGDRVIEISKIRVKVEPFQEGNAAFFDGAHWGLIDKKGTIEVNPKYDKLLAYYMNGLGPYTNSSNEIGFINPSRKNVIKCQFEEVLPFFAQTTVVKDKYYIFIDKSGESVSKTYLKYVPVNNIIDQYMNITNDMIRNLHINTTNIINTVINSLSMESVNGLSFNSTVIDVINYYKIPKSKLPKNDYQTYIQDNIELTGKIEPYSVKMGFSNPILKSVGGGNLDVNNNAKLKYVEFTLYTQSIEDSQIENIITHIKSKFENAKFTLDDVASNASWKPNTSIYKLDRSVIEMYYNTSEIIIKFDYSEYY